MNHGIGGQRGKIANEYLKAVKTEHYAYKRLHKYVSSSTGSSIQVCQQTFNHLRNNLGFDKILPKLQPGGRPKGYKCSIKYKRSVQKNDSLTKIRNCIDLNKKKYHNDLIFWLQELKSPIHGINLAGPSEFETFQYSVSGWLARQGNASLIIPEMDKTNYKKIQDYLVKFKLKDQMKTLNFSLTNVIEILGMTETNKINFLGYDYYCNPNDETFENLKNSLPLMANKAVISLTHSRWPITVAHIEEYFGKIRLLLKHNGFKILNDGGDRRVYGQNERMHNLTLFVKRMR